MISKVRLDEHVLYKKAPTRVTETRIVGGGLPCPRANRETLRRVISNLGSDHAVLARSRRCVAESTYNVVNLKRDVKSKKSCKFSKKSRSGAGAVFDKRVSKNSLSGPQLAKASFSWGLL